jgi:hypothetical protein
MKEPVSFERKFFAILLLSFLLFDIALLIGTPPRPVWISQGLVFIVAVLGFAGPLIALPIWQYRQRRTGSDARPAIQRIDGISACLTAFGIMTFGYKKLFHLQFRTPLSVADKAMSGLDGETLTWYYFGHSATFGGIIGFLQIGGAFLLIFRRTRLAGALLLLPVMVNILFVNIFYQMNPGALLQSLFLTLGLVYLLAGHYKRLIGMLFPPVEPGIQGRVGKQWLGAAVIGFFAFAYVLQLHQALPPESPFYGAYKVKDLRVKDGVVGHSRDSTAILNCTKVYFDLDNVLVLEYGSPDRRLMAKYTCEKTDRAWTVKSRLDNKGNPIILMAKADRKTRDEISLTGRLSGDSITIDLARIR